MRLLEPNLADEPIDPPESETTLSRFRSSARTRASSGELAARIVGRKKRSLVFLEPNEVWAFEAAQRLTYVHSRVGVFDLDLSLVEIEGACRDWVVRVHRRWLVNLTHVRELERVAGETTLFVGSVGGDQRLGVEVPVSRDRAQPLRDMLLANATGLRRG